LNGLIAVEAVVKREEERRRNACRCGRESGNYKLILMDCNMPVMDGFESTKKIKEYCN
jgi:CheY-like chemotaxis protein